MTALNHFGGCLIILLVISLYATFHYKWDYDVPLWQKLLVIPLVTLFILAVFEAFYWVIKLCF